MQQRLGQDVPLARAGCARVRAPGLQDGREGHEAPAGDELRAQSPFGRVGTPEEVAEAVLFLSSPAATWASGAVLDFNGASYLRT